MKLHPLALARVRSGFPTQEQLAFTAELNPNTIAKIESRHLRRIQPVTAVKLSRTLGIPVPEIAGWFGQDFHPLALARIEAGFASQVAFATEAGIHPVQLARLEAGRVASVRPATLGRLAAALGQDAAEVASWFGPGR